MDSLIIAVLFRPRPQATPSGARPGTGPGLPVFAKVLFRQQELALSGDPQRIHLPVEDEGGLSGHIRQLACVIGRGPGLIAKDEAVVIG